MHGAERRSSPRGRYGGHNAQFTSTSLAGRRCPEFWKLQVVGPSGPRTRGSRSLRIVADAVGLAAPDLSYSIYPPVASVPWPPSRRISRRLASASRLDMVASATS